MPSEKAPALPTSRFDLRDYSVSEEKALNFRIGRLSHPEDVTVKVGGVRIGGRKPVFIAGPCAVDDEHRFLKTIEALSKAGVKLVRANLFKFRTFPASFQGLGEEGLRIVEKAKKNFGVRIIGEVMDAHQIQVLSEVVDVFQVGARSMMNTALLKELAGAGRPVLLKRMFSATLGEFLAAAEYLAQEGNLDIILCERGIRTFEPWFRFSLDVPGIALLRRTTCLPVIADISHSLGRTDVAVPLAKAAIAAGAAGIMVEVHADPAKAMSDAKQQMTPDQFASLMKAIK